MQPNRWKLVFQFKFFCHFKLWIETTLPRPSQYSLWPGKLANMSLSTYDITKENEGLWFESIVQHAPRQFYQWVLVAFHTGNTCQAKTRFDTSAVCSRSLIQWAKPPIWFTVNHSNHGFPLIFNLGIHRVAPQSRSHVEISQAKNRHL